MPDKATIGLAFTLGILVRASLGTVPFFFGFAKMRNSLVRFPNRARLYSVSETGLNLGLGRGFLKMVDVISQPICLT